MERGDIYRVQLNPTQGREQQGHRPVIILSPALFNRLTKIPLVAPIATAGNASRYAGFSVSLMGAGTQTTGVICCDQIRALDLKARGAQWIERAPSWIMDDVLARILPLFESE